MGVVAAGGLPARLLVAGALALAFSLAAPAAASAETFVVNSIGDAVDAAPGDEFCDAGGGVCTLRAAIEEANALAGFDQVNFHEDPFDGGAGSTIDPAAPLPALDEEMGFKGRCERDGGSEGPCVGLDVSGLDFGFVAQGAAIEIEGLAITGAGTAILASAPKFKLFGSWIGVGLDGELDGNGTGVVIGGGADESRIGQATSTSRNVFAASAGPALALRGASEALVVGNYFGVKPDGATPAPSGENIEVVSVFPDENPASIAEDNVIGSRVPLLDAASPSCDSACNVISAAETTGIDIAGEDDGRGGEGDVERPAVRTSILANHLGLDATGAGAVPNGTVGVMVGAAERTTVGGANPGDANHVAGGEVGIEAGVPADGLLPAESASDLQVMGNFVGLDGAGEATQPPTQAAIRIESEGVPDAWARATVLDNEVAMDGGVGIDQHGFGAWIGGNSVEGAGTGIRATGPTIAGEPTREEGNLIERNSISASGGDGIRLENDLNEVVANHVSGAGGSGIGILGAEPFGVGGNLIGGDTGADENVIVGSGGAAIEIANVERSANEVARNRGAANAGLFIDLVRVDAPEQPGGPNFDIEPPIIAGAAPTGIAGEARPNARVRVFAKAGTEPGEIAGFIGEATADEEGQWSLVFTEPPAAGAVGATQTVGGATSELAIAAVSGFDGEPDPGPGGGSSGGGASADAPPASDDRRPGRRRADRKRPHTAIFNGPRAPLARGVARFSFGSNEFRTRFACALDGGRFRRCRSPKVFRGLDPGRHVFRVRAIDASGNVDPTPARWRFSVGA